ncbi:hypothetical protein NQZ68_025835 [Dissostichus eleginoides]|nr:hypothetical protein NQZ68_025835 [Dissostichus eleginoides]
MFSHRKWFGSVWLDYRRPLLRQTEEFSSTSAQSNSMPLWRERRKRRLQMGPWECTGPTVQGTHTMTGNMAGTSSQSLTVHAGLIARSLV